ncbi:MAG: UDP-N-acetylglucosamine 2-epimerase (non-hydrolyzing) [Deltaproteobacteria bacterium]|nr:UDP-N-acetylglucosamine 2-epimerase (non-hydrolyzing) [Deltaproteobacteria bacterium]
MKILTVVGARPQFIKAAVVSEKMRSRTGLVEVLVHTGQHYDDSMSKIFFEQLGLAEPTYNLGVGSASHGAQTGRMLEALESVLMAEKPDWVLVYGDTNSTLAGALAAAKLGLPLAHVEAGLRSYQRAMPEEINRVVTDRISDLLFAPTEAALRNLKSEGVDEKKLRLVGDVMFDAALRYVEHSSVEPLMDRHGLREKNFVLLTLHRAENTDSRARLSAIVEGLCEVARMTKVLFPVHPRTKAALDRNGLLDRVTAATICVDPLGYIDMLGLERAASVVVTDSGGVQKEAFFFGTPCLILRPTTEWVELLELDCARLCEPDGLADAVGNPPQPQKATAQRLFGGGAASRRIVDSILNARVA